MMDNMSLTKVPRNRDLIDCFFTPYLLLLASYIPRRIKPNHITLIGFFSGFLGVASLVFISAPIGLLIAALFFMFRWMLDDLDGIHARLTGQSSGFGAFLDAFCDFIFSQFFLFSVLYRFEMFIPIFVFISLLRVTAEGLVYLLKANTTYYSLPLFGASVEIFSWVGVLVGSFFIKEDALDLLWNSFLIRQFFEFFGIHSLNLVTIGMFLYLFFLPFTIIEIFIKGKQILTDIR